jgi:hypothetical protein
MTAHLDVALLLPAQGARHLALFHNIRKLTHCTRQRKV